MRHADMAQNWDETPRVGGMRRLMVKKQSPEILISNHFHTVMSFWTSRGEIASLNYSSFEHRLAISSQSFRFRRLNLPNALLNEILASFPNAVDCA